MVVVPEEGREVVGRAVPLLVGRAFADEGVTTVRVTVRGAVAEVAAEGLAFVFVVAAEGLAFVFVVAAEGLAFVFVVAAEGLIFVAVPSVLSAATEAGRVVLPLLIGCAVVGFTLELGSVRAEEAVLPLRSVRAEEGVAVPLEELPAPVVPANWS